MWKRYVLVFLLFALSACAELQQSAEDGGPASSSPKGEGLLKQQIVNAQEQNARLEVRVSKFEANISSLKNEIRGLETQQIRLEEKIDRIGQKMETLASSVSTSAVSRTPRGPSPKKETEADQTIRQALKRASQETPSSRSPGGSPSSIVPQAPVDFKKSAPSEKKRASLSPQEAYSRAYRSVREKKNKKAILQFEAFLQQFPKNRLAANAQYWLGESYYDMRDFPASLKEFQKVISRYPVSRKVPDALYKKGLAYMQIKDTRRAALEFEKLIQRFPDHPLTSRARKRLQSLNHTSDNKRP